MPDIISNTSCLIVLDNIGMLDILKELYGKIFTTNEVSEEFGKSIPDWIEVKTLSDLKYFNLMKNFVDPGEASTIALSVEMDDNKIILDDLKARKLAQKLNIEITGTIGVLIKARQKDIVKSSSSVMNKLKDEGFRISEELENELLKYDK
ncbi:MAG: DUF3368 domain-containing protein [Bacillota bacterium]